MKSEERHQLLQNDLGVVAEESVGFFEQHLMTIIAAVCGLLVALAIGFWWTRSSDSANAAGWTMLDSATNLEEFGTVVDKYKGTAPAHWAQLQIAEKTLQNAMPMMFSNREIALTDLKQSREGFESLLQDKQVAATIRERALWGLALSLETGCDGDTAKPVQAYERLLTEFPDSIFKGVAEERIASLKKPGAGDFYAWFSKEKPKPPDIRPADVKPGGIDLPKPSSPDDDEDGFMPKPPVNKPATDAGATTTPPATGENKTEETKSVGKTEAEKASAEKSETDKPAEPPKQPEPVKPVEGDKPPATEPPK